MKSEEECQSEKSPDCSWKGSSLYHLKQFKSLPIEEKFLAVEKMCEVYSFFNNKRMARMMKGMS
jgi:hypothetical protein